MILLFDNTDRGESVSLGVWGAFNSALRINEKEYEEHSVQNLIKDCSESGVSLFVITDSVELLRHPRFDPLGIFCDGSGEYDKRARENDLIFDKQTSRDKIVQSIITHLKRKKLL